MTNGITAWSASRLKRYEECPAAFKYEYIDKLPTPKSPAMDRGNVIHKGLEDFILNKTDALPDAKAIEQFRPFYTELRALKPIVEQEWAYTELLAATGWFAKNCWWRVKLDVGLDENGVFLAGDHKTGKKYGSNDEQLEQYALAVFRRYQHVKEVDTRIWYVDSGEEDQMTYTRQQAPMIAVKWRGRVRPMFEDTRFAPRPGQACRRCHFRRSNDGPCKFS